MLRLCVGTAVMEGSQRMRVDQTRWASRHERRSQQDAICSVSTRQKSGELIREFRVFVPDLMNVGYSERIAGLDGSLKATAARLVEFLEHMGLERTNILGSSYGGSVALKLAAMAPERFERLLLVSPANPFAQQYQPVLRFYLSSLGRIFIRLATF